MAGRPPLGQRLAFGLAFGLSLLLLLAPVLSFINEATGFDLYHGWDATFIDGDFSFFFYWVVYTIVFVLCVGGIFVRRNRQPIKPRGPYLQITSAVGGYLLVSWACWSPSAATFDSMWKCTYNRWLNNIGYTCLIVPFFLRSYRLFAVFNLSVKNLTNLELDFLRAPLLDGSSVDEKDERKNLRRKHRMGEDFLLKVFGVVLGLVAVYTGFMQYFGTDCGSNGALSNSVWVAAHSFECVVLLAMTLLLRNVRDEFNIVWELIIVICVCVVFMALHIVALFTSLSSWLHVWHYLMALRSSILLLTSAILPLLFSLYSTPIPMWSDTYTLDSLRLVLSDPTAIQYYLAFLTQEFGVEYLQFYMEVEMFRDFADPNKRRRASGYIYQKYFDSASPASIPELEKNTSIRSTIEGQLHSPGVNIFQNAQEVVYEVMNTKSFPRFVRSDLYARLRDQILVQSGVYGRLILSGMM